MHQHCLLVAICAIFLTFACGQGFHIPIHRRGGRSTHHELANLTHLSTILSTVEAKYARTATQVSGNRIVQQWRKDKYNNDAHLLNYGQDHTWYARLQVGAPPQTLEVDIDMLSADFYTIMTSSGRGSKYDTFLSSTHRDTETYAHDICRTLTELFTLPKDAWTSIPLHLNFPLCQPPKYSINTLHNSGSVLGLAPPITNSLSRLKSSLLEQLLDQDQIEHNVFSITLLDSESGILSLSSSIARQIEEVEVRNEVSLRYIDTLDTQVEEEIKAAIHFAIPPGSTHEEHFKWTDVGSGAAGGWHMTLVSGVWVDGVKVLKNQPVLFDVNCPFILAPSDAAGVVYDAVPGGRTVRSLTGAGEGYFAWPCLNAVSIEFEIAGWRFPLAKVGTREDDLHGPFGGSFSLGQVDVGNASTGYCVGVIIASDMASRKRWVDTALGGVWVLGEPFFKGLGVAFDMGKKNGKGQRMGVRVY